MDLKRKYTEASRTLKFDIYFIEELSIYPEMIQGGVLTQLIEYEEYLTCVSGLNQTVGGVVKGEPPFFFEIEYLKQEGEKAIYLDIIPLELDDYLDLITKKQTLTSNGNATREGTDVKVDS